MNVIHTEKAPAAIGPYSQAMTVNGLLYTSGQIAIVPATGAIAEGRIEAQTRQVCENLKNLVEAAGTTLDKVVKT
ncbi:MAG: Rid family hydrolase, partial [Oscillospiraceae bacterium]